MRRTSFLFLLTFLAVMLFGALLTAPMHHDTHCPFAEGCATTINHLEHWVGAFASTLTTFIVLLFVAVGVFTEKVFLLQPRLLLYAKARARDPLKPPLLQRLYARGILNRKAP